MSRSKISSTVLVALTMAGVLLLKAPAVQANPLVVVAKWVGQYLLGKAADKIWDKVTGQPDVKELDRRLHRVEQALAASDAKLAECIKKLREGITPTTTYDEYYVQAIKAVGDLDTRVKDLERKAEITEKKLKELEDRVSQLEGKQGKAAGEKERELIAGLRFGVRAQNDASGVVVRQVVPGFPATNVKHDKLIIALEPGDIITQVNGRVIRGEKDYMNALDTSPQQMTFSVINKKDGKSYECQVVLRY